jgi:hypothetical protein
MTYADQMSGMVGGDASDCGRDAFWTFDAVQEELIEALRLLWRLPSGGREPSRFATDGPWQHLTRAVRAEAGKMAMMELWRIEQEEAARAGRALQHVPLKAEEVTWMNERLEWLDLAPERDRKLVFEAVWQLARGQAKVSWTRIRKRMLAHPAWRDVAVSPKALGQRYSRAIAAIAMTLNAGSAALGQ